MINPTITGRAVQVIRHVPSKLETLGNIRGTWQRARIAAAVRDRVEERWPHSARGVLADLEPSTFVVRATLTRYTTKRSQGLDDDNLRSAFKPARDEITRQLGLKSDKASPSLAWEYLETKAESGWGWGWNVTIVAVVDLTPKPIPPRAPPKKRKQGAAALATPNTFPPKWSK